MTVAEAMQALDANPTEDTLNQFIIVVSDALAKGEPVPDVALKRYKLATGGAQPLPTVTVTEPMSASGFLKGALIAAALGLLYVLGGPGDEEDEDDAE